MKKFTILVFLAVLVSCNTNNKSLTKEEFISEVSRLKMEMKNKETSPYNSLTKNSSTEEIGKALEESLNIQEKYYKKIIDLKAPSSYTKEKDLDLIIEKILKINLKNRNFLISPDKSSVNTSIQSDLKELVKLDGEFELIISDLSNK